MSDLWLDQGAEPMRGPFVPSWLPRRGATPPPPRETSFSQLAEKLPQIPKSPPPPAIPYAPEGWISPDEADALHAQVAAAEAQLAEAIGELARVRREVLAASEPEVVRLALSIAEKVVGKTIELDPTMIGQWAAEGIAALSTKEDVVVAIGSGLAEHVFEAVRATGATLVVDPTLDRYGCEVRGRFARVRTSATDRFALVAESLHTENEP